jgi:gliding motility-associated-like protein
MKRCVIILLMGMFLLPFALQGQGGYNPNMHNGTVTVNCSNTYNFYDPGGPGGSSSSSDANGNYGNNQNFTQTFVAAISGMCLQVTFNSFVLESVTWDYLMIYDGPSTSSSLIGKYGGSNSPGTITSASGALTFKFHSDGYTNYAGWAATITCVECPPPGEEMHDGVVTLSCPETINFYDPGGPGGESYSGVNGNYGDNQDITQTFIAPEGQCLQVEFNSFVLESVSFDYLKIYDGPNTSSFLLGKYGGSNSPGTITSASGALTFKFHSDGYTNYAGWAATISCVECPSSLPCNPQSTANGSPCANNGIHPFCTEDNDFNVAYPSVTGFQNASSFLGASSYACLNSTPRPSWFYMQIENPGNILIFIQQYTRVLGNGLPDENSQGIDIDFACWGPFEAQDQEDFVEKLCCGYYNLNDVSHGNHRPINGNHNNDMGNYPDGNLVDCSYSSEPTEWCFIPNAQQGQWYLLLVCNYKGGLSSQGYSGYFGFTSQSTISYGGGQATTNCDLLAPFTYNNPVCVGDTLILTCTSPVAGATAYQWSGPGNWSATTTAPTVSIPNVTLANAGRYSLLPTGPNISATASYVDVSITATPNITVTANHDTVCSGNSVTLTAAGAGTIASNYRWTPGDATGRAITVHPTTSVAAGTVNQTYTVTGTNNGCSSTASYTIVVHPKPAVQIVANPSNAQVCVGDTLLLSATGGGTHQWKKGGEIVGNGDSLWLVPTVSGSNVQYRVIATSAEGCTNSATRSVQVYPLPNVSISGEAQVCRGGSVQLSALPNSSSYSYHWSTGANSRTIRVSPTEDTVYTVVVTSSQACTSSATKEVRVYLSDTTRYRDTICWNGSFQDGNFTINGPLEPGNHNYTRTYSSAASCDSVVILYLTVLTKPFELKYDTACNSYSWRGRTYNRSGTYMDTLTDGDGCMQVDTLHLIVYHADSESFEKDTCSSYTWRGHVYTQSGVYLDTLSDLQGCQQVDTLRLTIYHAVSESFVKDTCTSYLWRGHVYTQSGTYLDTLADEHGCTQVDTLRLTIYHAVPESFEKDTCSFYTWRGRTYRQSGTYLDTLTDGHGCRQVDTLHLTIYHAVSQNLTKDTCSFYTWRGRTYRQSGVYMDTLTDGHGCTQVDTLRLTIYNPEPSAERVIICEPNTYTWHGFQYDVTGVHTHGYMDQHNCHCVDTLYLTVTTEPELLLTSLMNATCNQDNGEIKVRSWGGTTPYRYVYLPDGENASFDNLSAGNYHLQMIDSIGCTADTTFRIENIIHQVGLVSVTDAHCGQADGAVQINASGGYGVFTYQWPSPIVSTSNVANKVKAGRYTVAVVDSDGCSLSLSFRVRDIPGPNACFNFNTTNEKQVTFINCTSQNVVYWHWSLGDGQESTEWQPSHIYSDPGEYPVVLTVEDENHCVDSVSLLYIIREVPTIYLPSAFIPESEIAENRVFKPIGNSISDEQYEMFVYDRWGQLIFVSHNPELGWDGRINGNLAPQGTYSYLILYLDIDGKPGSVRGSVLLLR